MHSSHSVIPLFSYRVRETLLEKQVPSDIREHVDADGEKEIASDKNWKEAF